VGALGRGFGGGWGGRGWGSSELQELAKTQTFDPKLALRALGAFRPYRWLAVGTVALIFLTSALGALPPLLIGNYILQKGLIGRNLHVLVFYSSALVAIALASGLLGVLQNWFSNLIGQAVMADFRQRMFEHLHRQPMSFFTDNQSGQLVSRITNDVNAIQSVVTNTLVSVVSNVLVLVTTLGVMFALNWELTALSLIIVPAFVAPTQHVGRVRQDLQRRIQVALAQLTAQLTETLGISGALLVKAFARERYEFERFRERNQQVRRLNVESSLVGRWLFMWLGLFQAIGPAALYALGGWFVIRGRLEVGTVVTFVGYLGRLYGPINQIAQLHVSVLTSLALFRRIYEILDRQSEIRDGPHVLDPASVRGRVAFEGVSFRYRPDLPPALDGVDLELPPGALVALVGPSGAGKSTLMNLVPRFHDPTAGRVTLDGRDIRDFTLESLRSVLGLVPQEPFLFHDTLLANLLYARPGASRQEVEEACRAAQIHDVILALPDGYDTVVGERGHRLSGGEKQRVAIARVLLRAPRIVLLDEATSSLDTLSERLIQAALEHLLAGRTSLVIAHRLSTILAADRIAVLEGGRLVGLGRHRELLAAGGLYARIYREQFETPLAAVED
jgi:ATP-binding cassette subfamily B protein